MPLLRECREFWYKYMVDGNAGEYVLGTLRIILTFTFVKEINDKDFLLVTNRE